MKFSQIVLGRRQHVTKLLGKASVQAKLNGRLVLWKQYIILSL